MTFRSIISALILSGAAALLLATSPMESPESPSGPPPEAPPAAPEPAKPSPVSLSGRQVWMVNAPEEDCAAAEALGLRVTCEPERPGAAGPELIVWCPEISQASSEMLLAALSLEGFTVRTWESQPVETSADECGEFYEITLRY